MLQSVVGLAAINVSALVILGEMCLVHSISVLALNWYAKFCSHLLQLLGVRCELGIFFVQARDQINSDYRLKMLLDVRMSYVPGFVRSQYKNMS
jgi:hypothetical protein